MSLLSVSKLYIRIISNLSNSFLFPMQKVYLPTQNVYLPMQYVL